MEKKEKVEYGKKVLESWDGGQFEVLNRIAG